MTRTNALRRVLLAWYDRNKRDLPWRRTRDPYAIWVSEIMLQQTRVAAAAPYYERFLARFPTVEALAAAPEEQVLACWAGLGYYSRARNLHRAAKQIAAAGAFPKTCEEIRDLPGVGAYTAAAVASIAFGEAVAAVDGNVLRVLSRVTAEHVPARLRETASELLDPRRPGDFNQALMELGATVCTPRNMSCSACPVQQFCEARALGREREFPMTLSRARKEGSVRTVLVIIRRGKLLVWRRARDSKRLASFWELPEPEHLPRAVYDVVAAEFRHTIVNTTYTVRVARATHPRTPAGFRWMPLDTVGEMPLSTTARKALACLEWPTVEAGHRLQGTVPRQ